MYMQWAKENLSRATPVYGITNLDEYDPQEKNAIQQMFTSGTFGRLFKPDSKPAHLEDIDE